MYKHFKATTGKCGGKNQADLLVQKNLSGTVTNCVILEKLRVS